MKQFNQILEVGSIWYLIHHSSDRFVNSLRTISNVSQHLKSSCKCADPRITEDFLFSIGLAVIFEKKYFYQQKIYAIKIIFLTLRVGGIFSSGSLPSEALSSHVLASSGCWGSCQFLLVPKHQFVPCTLSLLPQRSFWQHLHCDLASAAVLETWARSISIRGSLRSHLLQELVSPHCQVLHLRLLCCE